MVQGKPLFMKENLPETIHNDVDEETKPMKRTLILLCKIAVSLVLIVYLFSKTDIVTIWMTMKSANISLLILAFFLIALGYLLITLRWQILLNAQGIKIQFWKLTKYYLVGTFFNNFLPTTIGGDIVRTYDVSRSSGSMTQSFAIIMVERLTGVFALIVYAIIGLLLGYSTIGNFPLVWVAGGALVILLFILLCGVIIQGGKQIEDVSVNKISKIKNKINKIFYTLHRYRNKKLCLLKSLVLAFILQFNVIIFFYIISYSIDLRPPFFYFLIIIPLIHVILMFPVSINGIGVRENAFIFFLSKIGISAAASVALSWLAFSMVLIYATVGGIIYACR